MNSVAKYIRNYIKDNTLYILMNNSLKYPLLYIEYSNLNNRFYLTTKYNTITINISQLLKMLPFELKNNVMGLMLGQ